MPSVEPEHLFNPNFPQCALGVIMSEIRASAAPDFVTISDMLPKLMTKNSFPCDRTVFNIMTPSIATQTLNIIDTVPS